MEKSENLINEINQMNKYTWIFFTSVHSVEVFFYTMMKLKKDIRSLQGIKIFCVGEKTRQAVEKKGIFVDKVPQQYNSKSAAEEMECFLKKEDRILFPASELAGTILQEKAKNMGVEMVRVTAYENHINIDETIKRYFEKGAFDAVGFFSSSQVKNLFSIVGGENIKNCELFAIGEMTAESIVNMGGTVKAIADVSTGEGLAHIILQELC